MKYLFQIEKKYNNISYICNTCKYKLNTFFCNNKTEVAPTLGEPMGSIPLSFLPKSGPAWFILNTLNINKITIL